MPTLADLAVFLQLLPALLDGRADEPLYLARPARRPGTDPAAPLVVLLDAGRTKVLRARMGRQALHCIRCSACLNVCPVYTRTGRSCLRLRLPRADRCDPRAAARRDRERRFAPVRLEPLWRLLRGLPGEDRHPDRAAAPARAGGRGDGEQGRAIAHALPRGGSSAARGASRSPSGWPCLRNGRFSPVAGSPACPDRSPAGRRRVSCDRSLPRRSANGGRGGPDELTRARSPSRVRAAIARGGRHVVPRGYRSEGAEEAASSGPFLRAGWGLPRGGLARSEPVVRRPRSRQPLPRPAPAGS